MPALHAFTCFERVAILMTEVGNVDHCERIGRLDPKRAARRHVRKPLACLHDGKRALQSTQVVGLSFREGHFCQNFQKGFLVVSSTT